MKITPIQKQSPITFGNSAQLKRLAEHCAYCGITFTKHNQGTFDHIVPKARHGLGTIHNGAMSCAHCNNNLKGSLPLDVFFKRYPWARLNFVKYLDELRGRIIDGVNYSQEITRRFL